MYAHSQLNQDHRYWLGALRASAEAEHGILACHGTPSDDNQYLVEAVSDGRLVRARSAIIQERLGEARRAVLCGHSHQQHLIQFPHGPLMLNLGSVGRPSYDDPGPDPHVSEAGSPHARYAILTIDEEQMSAEMLVVAYDWTAAAARAEKNGRPEWANGLRTGWFIAGTRTD